MKYNMRYKNRKINIKKLSISLSILIILLILITKLSLKHAAENFNDNLNKDEDMVGKTPILQETTKDVSKEEQLQDIPIEKKPDISKTKNKNKKKDSKIETNINRSQGTENIKTFSEYGEIFKRDLFIGDSITDSLSYYELIDENNVIAKLGFTTKKAQEEIEEIINKNPDNIYLLFGMNDMLTFKDNEKFIKHYKELINEIRNQLPSATIYVQSILPVSAEVKAKKPFLTNENIETYNQALRDMTEEENVKYLNIRDIVEDNMDLLEPDGIHVKYKFYELWLQYLIDNTK